MLHVSSSALSINHRCCHGQSKLINSDKMMRATKSNARVRFGVEKQIVFQHFRSKKEPTQMEHNDEMESEKTDGL